MTLAERRQRPVIQPRLVKDVCFRTFPPCEERTSQEEKNDHGPQDTKNSYHEMSCGLRVILSAGAPLRFVPSTTRGCRVAITLPVASNTIVRDNTVRGYVSSAEVSRRT